MAKAQAPAEKGDRITIIKDDENSSCIGTIEEVQGDTLLVSFGHTANLHEYSPEEVILIPATHILD